MTFHIALPLPAFVLRPLAGCRKRRVDAHLERLRRARRGVRVRRAGVAPRVISPPRDCRREQPAARPG
jgi:hypothetical protein